MLIEEARESLFGSGEHLGGIANRGKNETQHDNTKFQQHNIRRQMSQHEIGKFGEKMLNAGCEIPDSSSCSDRGSLR